MPSLPIVDDAKLEAICRVLGDTSSGLTGSEIATLLGRCGVPDPAPQMTKWRRLFSALHQKQAQDRCSNNVFRFIEEAMAPARYISDASRYNGLRIELNEALAFCGAFLRDDGRLASAKQAKTLNEARTRASKLRDALLERDVHPYVLGFCRAELVQENYFHAVFEATKSIAEKLRDRTGLTTDGAELTEQVFSVGCPLLAINTLRTETELSEQKGFANLIKGMFGVFRNVTAHAPKIKWPINEQDALDLLSLVSYLHRRIDSAVAVPAAKSGG